MDLISKLTVLLACTAITVASCETIKEEENDKGNDELSLEVSTNEITYNENDAEANSFTVIASTGWYADSDNASLTFEPESGSAGETLVRITGITPGQKGTITITTRRATVQDPVKTAEVTVSREDDGSVVDILEIYYDDLDGGDPPYSSYLDQWDGFINATGPGAANVSYSGMSITVADNYQSRGYTGASGQNAINFARDNMTLTISGITLQPGQTSLEFSFGVTPPSGGSISAGENLKLYAALDGGDGGYEELEFTTKKGSGTWSLATAVFGITGGTPSTVDFSIWAEGTYTKVDDFRLATTDKTVSQTIEYTNKDQSVPWPETPETINGRSSYKYVTHWTETVVTGKRVRNYSACYDTERHNPVWVAYPMHACYNEGGGERTTPDPWRPDPEFQASEQSVIYGSDWDSWPWGKEHSEELAISDDPYQYWYNPSFSVTRGHLLRSADRGGHNKEMNIQTFYPTNIAPERFRNPDVHTKLESLLPNKWICADTVYVVAGCWYKDDNIFVYDKCSNSIQSTDSKECDVPAAQFKIYLRTKDGSTGKRISDCTADELMAIGFWLPQDIYGEGQVSGGDIRDFAYSVDKIEEMTGGEFRFFPEVPDEVTAGYNLSDWGL